MAQNDIQSLIDSLDDFLIDGAKTASGTDSRVNEPEGGTMENNIYGTGYVSLQWRSTDGGVLPKGTEIIVAGADPDNTTGSEEHTFVLPKAYVPTNNGDGTWTYTPKFSTVGEKLDRILFYIESSIAVSQGEEPESIRLYTFYYSGSASGIVSALSGCSPGTVSFANGYNPGQTIYVSFDGDSIKSAAQKIASALGAEIIVSETDITIKEFDAVSDEVYDQLLILGGTRNMGKKTLADSTYYAAITQRLMLDPSHYPNSLYPAGKDSASATTKILIFDDIFPEMKLTIGQVYERPCYMLDENGNTVIDHYEKDGETVTPDTEGATPVHKTYIKFYITLNHGEDQYNLDPQHIIAGKPLGILFQSGTLMGREFDLAMFTSEENEQMADDIEGGHTAQAGEFRIIMQADGSTLLPNADLKPAAGDTVTLTGVVLDESYTNDARDRLLQRAKEVAPMYLTESETEAEYKEEPVVDDFLEDATLPNQNQRLLAPSRLRSAQSADLTTTSVKTDLTTGSRTIVKGTFQPKGVVSSMVQKVDGVSLSGGAATMGAVDAYTRNTAPMGIDQLKALLNAGGHLGMVTVNNRFSSAEGLIATLQSTFNDVKEQADRKFDIWFIEGAPSPLKTNPSATANFPASEWQTTDEKEAHLQDVCYDVTRSAGATGGYMWRYVKEAVLSNGEPTGAYTYYWEEIEDGDTLASLEQIADLSADNILTPAEKLVVRRDWAGEFNEYNNLYTQATAADVSCGDYVCAFYSLWNYFNDNSNHSNTETAASYTKIQTAYTLLTVTPSSERATEARALIATISDTDTNILAAISYIDQGKYADAAGKLIDYVRSLTINNPATMLANSTNTVINGAVYKALWNAYWEAKTALMTALSEKSIQKLDDMASDTVLTDIEKQEVIREYNRVKKETAELLLRGQEAGLSNTTTGDVLYDYRAAYSALYAYLDDLTTSGYTIMALSLENASDPAMLTNGEDTTITSAFTTLWEAYYAAASDLRAACQSARVKVFVTTGNNTPTPPYKAGDLWVHTDSSGKSKIRICTTSRATGSFTAADWVEHDIYTDPRSVLAALGEMVFQEIKDTSTTSVSVNLSTATPTISNISQTLSSAAASLLAVLKAMIGGVTFTITWSDNAPSGTPNTWSLHCRRVSFQVPNSQNDVITGGCQISMYNENGAWEFIQQSTSSLLDNLGTMINAVVFGSSAAATEAAGLTIGQRFSKMFAAAQVWDETTGSYMNLTQALFGLSINEYYKNGNTLITKEVYEALSDKTGYTYVGYMSTAKMSAEMIDFAGKTITLDALQSLTFSGGTIDFNSAGAINLNASVVNLNADKISWVPASGKRSLINRRFDGLDVDTFAINANGAVELKKAIIQEATISHATITNSSIELLKITGNMYRSVYQINKFNNNNCFVDNEDGTYELDLSVTGINIHFNLDLDDVLNGNDLIITLPTTDSQWENAECVMINTCTGSVFSNAIKIRLGQGTNWPLQRESSLELKCVRTNSQNAVTGEYKWVIL